MTVAVDDILRVVATLVWTDGNICQNVFNCLVASGAGPFDDQDVVDDMEDWLDNMYLNVVNNLSDELDGSQCQVYKYDSVGDDWDEVGTNTFTFDPSSGADQMPRGVAMLVTARTSNADVQGKKYIPGITEQNVTDGLLVGGQLTNNLAFAADWITNFVGSASGATFDPGVWSPTDLVLYLMASQVAATAIPAYQRRRKRGVGA